jgi:hypothetical protein
MIRFRPKFLPDLEVLDKVGGWGIGCRIEGSDFRSFRSYWWDKSLNRFSGERVMSIARSSSRSALFAMGAISIALAMPATSSAGIVINVTEIGSNLKVDYSGGFTGILSVDQFNSEGTFFGVDTNELFALAVESPQGFAQINGTLASNGGTNPRTNLFPSITPGSFPTANSVDGGSQTLILGTSGGNYLFGADPSFTGGSYSGTGGMTFNGASFASWGLTAGQTAIWNWTENGETFVPGNTVTVVAVPEPQVLALAGTVGVAIVSGFRRKKPIAARS